MWSRSTASSTALALDGHVGLVDMGDGVAGMHGLAHRHLDGADDAGVVGVHDVLHLHGLDHGQDGAFVHGVAGLHVDGDDRALERGRDRRHG